MRDTTGLDPMWESGEPNEAGSRIVRAVGGVVRGAGKRIAPRVLSWASAQQPRISLAWGRKVVHVQGDGVVTTRRQGEGWGDNPRRNYNDAVQKRQEREASKAEAAPQEDEIIENEPEAAPPEEPEPEAPAVDLSLSALEAEVQKTMGLSDGSEEAAEVSRDPDTVKAQLVGVRSLLQALDDVADWDLVEAVDEDLYQLHKAVEYKLRNHKASEAKAQLNDLFK